MDVLERASRWLGTNTRPDRGTRRRFQGVHSGNQNGEAARLSSGDDRNDLQRNRHAGDRTNVRLSFGSWRGWSYDYPWIRLRRRQEGHDQTAEPAPGKLLSYPRNDETRGKPSSSISARNRNPLAAAAKFSLLMA